ncbi:hypothetical protein H6G36_27040 [Anabaena minutissima FACHB-250]|nr:hypothetical protein [Anabaena minutissima FACHB-250]
MLKIRTEWRWCKPPTVGDRPIVFDLLTTTGDGAECPPETMAFRSPSAIAHKPTPVLEYSGNFQCVFS